MSFCDNLKECVLKTVLCLYKQPYIKEVVNYAIIKYDEYCDSSETVELTTKTEMDTSDLDDLLADLDCDLKMD